MKKVNLFLSSLCLILSGSVFAQHPQDNDSQPGGETITITSSITPAEAESLIISNNGQNANLIIDGVTDLWINNSIILSYHSIELKNGANVSIPYYVQVKVSDFVYIHGNSRLRTAYPIEVIAPQGEVGMGEFVIADNSIAVCDAAKIDNLVLNGGTFYTYLNDSDPSGEQALLNKSITFNGGTLEYDLPMVPMPGPTPGGIVEGPNLTFAEGATVIVNTTGVFNDQYILNKVNNGEIALELGQNASAQGFARADINLNLTKDQWNFIGIPTTGNGLKVLVADGMPNIWAVEYDYTSNEWSSNYMHYGAENQENDVLDAGQGIFVWTDRNTNASIPVTYSTATKTMTYTGNATNGSRWFALANPYGTNKTVNTFITDNQGKLQGGEIYVYNGTTFNPLSNGVIAPGQGFFVNMYTSGDNTICFNHGNTAKSYNNETKSSAGEREFLTISVLTDDYAVPVRFAHNDNAMEQYDIFDADKLFGSGAVAEPYLVCGERKLCKEEVDAQSYVAKMNIKSSEAQNVKIVASNIPSDYELVLFDGQNEIAMTEGNVYTTDILEGENSNRFKLAINKKNVSLNDINTLADVRIVNSNRNIVIFAQDHVKTEVYNTLGQKVYESNETNFVLNGITAGAYVIKSYTTQGAKTQKIIVE